MSTAPDLGHLPASLDELASMAPGELLELYRKARVPAVPDLEGDLRGRMLASPLFSSRPSLALTRWLGALRFFPWRGKSLRPLADEHGEGINRVIRWKWFRFKTRVGPSRAGDFAALQFDYDLPENPWFIRRVKDEVREVAPGLWLGQAYFAAGKGATLVIYFGLERPRA